MVAQQAPIRPKPGQAMPCLGRPGQAKPDQTSRSIATTTSKSPPKQQQQQQPQPLQQQQRSNTTTIDLNSRRRCVRWCSSHSHSDRAQTPSQAKPGNSQSGWWDTHRGHICRQQPAQWDQSWSTYVNIWATIDIQILESFHLERYNICQRRMCC